MSHNLKNIIESFNLDELEEMKEYLKNFHITMRLVDGHSNLVYIISNGKDKRILKVFRNLERDNEKIVQLRIEVPKTFIETKYLRIDEFIESRKGNFQKDFSEIIKCLKSFHQTKINKDEICSFKELAKKNIISIKNYKIQGILKNILKQLPEIELECVIHNDLVEKNMLCRNDNSKIILIDFEYSCYGEKILDLAGVIQGIRESLFTLDDLLEGKEVPERKYDEVIAKYYGVFSDKNKIRLKSREQHIFFFKLLWALNNRDCEEVDIKKYVKVQLKKLMKSSNIILDKNEIYSLENI